MGTIVELDGPPKAYFDTPAGRLTYVAFRFSSADAHKLGNFTDAFLANLRSSLRDYPNHPVLYWRQRPSMSVDDTPEIDTAFDSSPTREVIIGPNPNFGKFYWGCRLAASVPLPEWCAALAHVQGGVSRSID